MSAITFERPHKPAGRSIAVMAAAVLAVAALAAAGLMLLVSLVAGRPAQP